MRRSFPRVAAIAASIAILPLLTGIAFAHEHRGVGDHEFVVGWRSEPAFAGEPNAVSVAVSHGGTEPIEGAQLKVVVLFGDRNAATRTKALTLDPAFGEPGSYEAPIVPSRPGRYTFHVTGSLEGSEKVDEYFTSGDKTFDEVADPASNAFPVRDPSTGQVAERLGDVHERTVEVQSRATLALVIGAAGVVLALLGLVLRRR